MTGKETSFEKEVSSPGPIFQKAPRGSNDGPG